MKFLPTYLLGVEVPGGVLPLGPDDNAPATANITVALPYSVEFEITRAALSSSQTATFRFTNLNDQTRARLQKDWFNVADIRAIQFSAGYEDENLSKVFNGTVKSAVSYRREGSPDDITEIQAWDGGSAMVNGYSLRSIAGGAVFSDILRTLAKDLPGLAGSPIIGAFTAKTSRGSVYAGNTWQAILAMSDGLAIIDDNRLKVLNQNEVLEAELPLIDSSALLGSPTRAGAMIKAEILFEPRLILGQIIVLKSQVNPVYNGAYKVVGFTHRGTISPAVDGTRRTELTLWDGVKSLGGFRYVSGEAAAP